MSERFKVVIPARLASERLPEKPLADLGGRPMVVRCLERALEAGAEEVVVAVDDERLLDAVRAAGGDAQLTSRAHASGTDRLAEVARQRGWDESAIIVNLQGDEPLIPPALLARLAAAASARPEVGIATMAVRITSVEELFQESVVKAVLDDRGHALTFSRAPIPWVRGVFGREVRELPSGVPFLRHLGLYAYRARTLARLAATERGPLEIAESLEQLRALALGIAIHVTVLDEAPPPGVDTAEDLARVRRHFEA